MSLRLTIKDLKLIKFIGKYKVIKAIDCKIIYKSKDYYLKRLKALEKARYIYRYKRFYIKLDIEGRKLWNLLGYKSYNLCRNKDYQERLNAVRKIALLGLDSKIEFTPSWEIKEENLEIMRLLEDADIYDILCEVYPHKEILLSNWNKSDYMTEDRIYIIWMPFIDIEKLRALNTYIIFNFNISFVFQCFYQFQTII